MSLRRNWYIFLNFCADNRYKHISSDSTTPMVDLIRGATARQTTKARAGRCTAGRDCKRTRFMMEKEDPIRSLPHTPQKKRTRFLRSIKLHKTLSILCKVSSFMGKDLCDRSPISFPCRVCPSQHKTGFGINIFPVPVRFLTQLYQPFRAYG